MPDETTGVTPEETNEEQLETTPVEPEGQEETTRETAPEEEQEKFFLDDGRVRYRTAEDALRGIYEKDAVIRQRSIENRQKEELLRQREADLARLRADTERKTVTQPEIVTVEQASAKVESARNLIKRLKFDPSGDYEEYQQQAKDANEALADAISELNQANLYERQEAKRRTESDAAARAQSAKIETYQSYAAQNPELYQITDDIYVVNADPQHPQHKNLLNSEMFLELLDRGFTPEDAHLFVAAKSGHTVKTPDTSPGNNNKPKATSPEQKVYDSLKRGRASIKPTTVEADAPKKRVATNYREGVDLARQMVSESAD